MNEIHGFFWYHIKVNSVLDGGIEVALLALHGLFCVAEPDKLDRTLTQMIAHVT